MLHQQFRAGLPDSLTEKDIPILEILNKTEGDNNILRDVAFFRYKEKKIYIATMATDVQDEAQIYAWMQDVGKLMFQKI